MDEKIRETLASFGYEFNSKGDLMVKNLIVQGSSRKRLTYYRTDPETGAVRACPDLPADAYNMKAYLEKGLTLDPPSQKPLKKQFVCETCNVDFPTQQALAGHSNKHRK